MGEQVYENFKSFCKKKKSTDDVFSDLTPTILNAHLKGIMEGLTAKVFRTYNASKTLQDELTKTEQSASWKRLSASEKVVEYNNANREVAILCNHQRSVSKAQEANLEGLGAKLEKLKEQKKVLKKILKRVSGGEDGGIPKRKDPAKLAAKAAEALERAKKMKESAKTKEEKIAATEADEKAKVLKRGLADAKFDDAHLWDGVPKTEQVIKRIQTWSDKIKKMEMNIKHKDDNKEVSLGTSKVRVTKIAPLTRIICRALLYGIFPHCMDIELLSLIISVIRWMIHLLSTTAKLHGSANFSRVLQAERGAHRKDFLEDAEGQVQLGDGGPSGLALQ